MKTLFNTHGLVFWDEKEILLRDHIVQQLHLSIITLLRSMNRAWLVERIEAPILTPTALLSGSYSDNEVWRASDTLTLRPETTPGSYTAARHLLQTKGTPMCVWQVGKSFRKECHSKSYAHMSLDEFWQIEFQCIYTTDSKNDYHAAISSAFFAVLLKLLRGINTQMVPSDRLPSYSEITLDIEADNGHKMLEVCSISRRNDFKHPDPSKECRVIEVAVGLDRLVSLISPTVMDNK